MKWLLPEGVEELVPPAGWALEDLRRRLLDLFREQGYELILPPLIEHLDSLLSGAGAELELQTFRFTDQLSGRQLGLRADITPQAARIDARHLDNDSVARVCYLGTVVRTQPDTVGGARCLRQLGAEIFGEAGLAADLEICQLMLAVIAASGVSGVTLDLGHVGIYRALAREAGLDGDDEAQLFELLQAKAVPDLRAWLDARAIAPPLRAGLGALVDLYGGTETIARAREQLAGLAAGVDTALDELERLAGQLHESGADLHVDLAELRGYRYHTGVVFAAFVPGHGRELARGGRYDGVGGAYGAARPATGFSTDINQLMQVAGREKGANG